MRITNAREITKPIMLDGLYAVPFLAHHLTDIICDEPNKTRSYPIQVIWLETLKTLNLTILYSFGYIDTKRLLNIGGGHDTSASIVRQDKWHIIAQISQRLQDGRVFGYSSIHILHNVHTLWRPKSLHSCQPRLSWCLAFGASALPHSSLSLSFTIFHTRSREMNVPWSPSLWLLRR